MATYADVLAIAEAAVPAGTYPTPNDEPAFAKLVRSASFILTENDPISYDNIRQITPSTYWDAFIYLASKRKATVVREDDIQERGFLYIEDEVLTMLTPDGQREDDTRYGMYGDGIRWYIAKLVAAHLVRTIPLNSSLKQVDIADNLEEQAYAGLARIVDLTNVSFSEPESDAETENGQVTLYIAHDINKASIPEASFNIPDAGSVPPTFDLPVNLDDSVEILKEITVPAGQVGYFYYYMTAQAVNADRTALLSADNNTDSSHVSFKIDGVYPLVTESSPTNIDKIIIDIADTLNNEMLRACTAEAPTCTSNIIVAPQRGTDKVENFTVYKKILYPETTTLKTRRANFKTCHRVNHLSFDVRRMSTKVASELLTIIFYTVDETVWNNHQGDPVSFPLSYLRANSTLGIEGLLYGQQDSYREMAGTSPVSIILKVEKGNAIPVSIQDAGTSTDPSDQFGNAEDLAKTDTFYFAVNDPFTTFTTNLVLRISSTDYLAEAPAIITVDLSGIMPAASPPPNCVGEQVAERVVEAIYQYTRDRNKNQDILDNSNVLGVLLGQYQYEYLNINRDANTVTALDLTDSEPKDDDAGRVQIVGFRYKDEEFKIVVDLIQVPAELCVATGNYLARRTLWVQGKPRSICVETKVLTSNTSSTQTEAEVLASVAATVVPAEASMSPLLQKVYDKQKLLKDAHKGYPRKWQDY